MEPRVVASRDSAIPRRIVRSFLIVLGGIVGVVLGLMVLTALARPAGAAALPSVSVPAVSVPAVSVPPVSVPPVSVPAVSVPAVSVPGLAITGTQPVPAVPSLAQVGKDTATGVSGSAGSVPAAVATTTNSLAAPVVAAVRSGASPLTAGLGVPIASLVGGSLLGALGPGNTPGLGVAASPASGNGAVPNNPIYALEAFAPAPGSANPLPSPTPPAPRPAPPTPLPSTNSFLAVNDMSADSGPAQGGSPFGILPPSGLLPAVLALGGVLLLRGTRPRLLLDLRCSPPG